LTTDEIGTRVALIVALQGGAEMSYRVIPLLVFLGIELVGGIALFTDAGIRLLRERRR
jgi:hypothetical protein